MNEFGNLIQLVFNTVKGWEKYFLGETDGLMIVLLILIGVNYLTEIMRVIFKKKSSSKTRLHFICQKLFIFVLIGIANILYVQIILSGNILRKRIILFYVKNEGISLLKNAQQLGLPIPPKLNIFLENYIRNQKTRND